MSIGSKMEQFYLALMTSSSTSLGGGGNGGNRLDSFHALIDVMDDLERHEPLANFQEDQVVVREIVEDCRKKCASILRAPLAETVRNIVSSSRKRLASKAALDSGTSVQHAQRHLNTLIDLLGTWSNIVSECLAYQFSRELMQLLLSPLYTRVMEAALDCFKTFQRDKELDTWCSRLLKQQNNASSNKSGSDCSVTFLDMIITQVFSMRELIHHHYAYLYQCFADYEPYPSRYIYLQQNDSNRTGDGSSIVQENAVVTSRPSSHLITSMLLVTREEVLQWRELDLIYSSLELGFISISMKLAWEEIELLETEPSVYISQCIEDVFFILNKAAERAGATGSESSTFAIGNRIVEALTTGNNINSGSGGMSGDSSSCTIGVDGDVQEGILHRIVTNKRIYRKSIARGRIDPNAVKWVLNGGNANSSCNSHNHKSTAATNSWSTPSSSKDKLSLLVSTPNNNNNNNNNNNSSTADVTATSTLAPSTLTAGLLPVALPDSVTRSLSQSSLLGQLMGTTGTGTSAGDIINKSGSNNSLPSMDAPISNTPTISTCSTSTAGTAANDNEPNSGNVVSDTSSSSSSNAWKPPPPSPLMSATAATSTLVSGGMELLLASSSNLTAGIWGNAAPRLTSSSSNNNSNNNNNDNSSNSSNANNNDNGSGSSGPEASNSKYDNNYSNNNNDNNNDDNNNNNNNNNNGTSTNDLVTGVNAWLADQLSPYIASDNDVSIPSPTTSSSMNGTGSTSSTACGPVSSHTSSNAHPISNSSCMTVGIAAASSSSSVPPLHSSTHIASQSDRPPVTISAASNSNVDNSRTLTPPTSSGRSKQSQYPLQLQQQHPLSFDQMLLNALTSDAVAGSSSNGVHYDSDYDTRVFTEFGSGRVGNGSDNMKEVAPSSGSKINNQINKSETVRKQARSHSRQTAADALGIAIDTRGIAVESRYRAHFMGAPNALREEDWVVQINSLATVVNCISKLRHTYVHSQMTMEIYQQTSNCSHSHSSSSKKSSHLSSSIEIIEQELTSCQRVYEQSLTEEVAAYVVWIYATQIEAILLAKLYNTSFNITGEEMEQRSGDQVLMNAARHCLGSTPAELQQMHQEQQLQPHSRGLSRSSTSTRSSNRNLKKTSGTGGSNVNEGADAVSEPASTATATASTAATVDLNGSNVSEQERNITGTLLEYSASKLSQSAYICLLQHLGELIATDLLDDLIYRKPFSEWGALLLHQEVLALVDYMVDLIDHTDPEHIHAVKSAFDTLMFALKVLTLDAPGDIRRYSIPSCLFDSEDSVRNILGRRVEFSKDAVAMVKLNFL